MTTKKKRKVRVFGSIHYRMAWIKERLIKAENVIREIKDAIREEHVEKK